MESCPVFNTSEITVAVVVQDGRYFRRPSFWVAEVSVSSSSWLTLLGTIEQEKRSLSDRVDLWDLSRIQECVRGPTVRSTDIEREDELPRSAVIWCACHEETTTVQISACWAKVVYLPRTRHTFLSGRDPYTCCWRNRRP